MSLKFLVNQTIEIQVQVNETKASMAMEQELSTWESMIDKYEHRNARLLKKISKLQCRYQNIKPVDLENTAKITTPSSVQSDQEFSFTTEPGVQATSARKNVERKSLSSILEAPEKVESLGLLSTEEMTTSGFTRTDIVRPAELQKSSTTPHYYGASFWEGDPSIELTLSDVVDSSPMEITEIRKVYPDNLLVKWKPPASHYVTGYDILVDGVIKSHVYSSSRTAAILHKIINITLKTPVQITIYALTSSGRCEPPVHKVFQV